MNRQGYVYKILSFAAAIMLIIFLASFWQSITDFFSNVELKTFDARQHISSTNKKPDDRIVLVTIDEKSYTELTKEADWPVSRDKYAKVIERIQKDKPAVIALDLMFINPDKNDAKNDDYLATILSKYDNIFTSFNFDDEPPTSREPVNLNDRLKITVENHSKADLKKISYSNCRSLIPRIMNSKANLGEITAFVDSDGTLRELYPLAIYKGNYYPNLSLKVAQKLLKNETNKIILNSRNQLVLGDKKIPFQKDTGIILSWYKDFETVSFIDIYNGTYDKSFKDKIVYIGATASSLYDLKNTPIDSSISGVYLHMNFINNFLTDSFVHRTTFAADVAISLLLSMFLVVSLFRINRQIVDIIIFIGTAAVYLFVSGRLMDTHHLWIPVVMPMLSIVATFIIIYIIKYFLKSKDLEYTYKLATTDGLTELYNHRFFQEQLLMHIETSKRYNSNFSLLLIDIDYFKKFNDKYGHQAGDAVLKQVASMLKKLMRSTDIVCRYGGEEMAIILPSTSNEEAKLTAQKICEHIAQTPFKLTPTTTQNVTVSLGVATYPMDGKTSSELIEYADRGLYAAKANGRNQVGMRNEE